MASIVPVLVNWEHIDIVWLEGERAVLCNPECLEEGSLFPAHVFQEKFSRLKIDFSAWALGNIDMKEFCVLWGTSFPPSIRVKEFLFL